MVNAEVSVYRDINLAEIPQKFRRLLDAHNGHFTLQQYMIEEGTFLGMFEFLAVKHVMTTYMSESSVLDAFSKGRIEFKVLDFAPDKNINERHSGNFVSYIESDVLAYNYEFNEEAYTLWLKNGLKVL